MDNKTTFRFVGSIVNELPNMITDSCKMSTGDVITWINASIKVVESVGKIVAHCIDKNNIKLIKNEIDDFNVNEQKYQEQLEQEMLVKKQSDIKAIEEEFKRKKIELSKKIQMDLSFSYSSELKRKEEISAALADTRAKLKTIIDIYNSAMIQSEGYSEKEKRDFDECKRLLLKQYYKTIDI